jgi:hypothetical protein
MALISFGQSIDECWFFQGWGFRQVLCNLTPYVERDSDLVAAIDQAEATSDLLVDWLGDEKSVAMAIAVTRCVMTYGPAILYPGSPDSRF